MSVMSNIHSTSCMRIYWPEGEEEEEEEEEEENKKRRGSLTYNE